MAISKTTYVHQARYGLSGESHSRLPQYMVRGKSVYATHYNTKAPQGKALYTVKGRSWYATGNHPDGKSTHSLFTTRGDKLHTTINHPKHMPGRAAFVLKNNLH